MTLKNISKGAIALLAISLLTIHGAKAEKHLRLIPQPEKVLVKKGSFNINKDYSIEIAPNLNQCTKSIRNIYLEPLFQNASSKKVNAKIIFKTLSNINSSTFLNSQNEAYDIDIEKDNIVLAADSPLGFIRAGQTLNQILLNEKNKTRLLSCEISDSPKYAWRGCMLDVSRHCFPIDFIKKQIDILASFKINKVHMHLTDAAGWRIEIKKYPRLISHTAWRTESEWNKWWSGDDRTYVINENWKDFTWTPENTDPEQNAYDNLDFMNYRGTIDSEKGYGGFYTQEELKDLVKYAEARGITIVPEIEMPGHSEEALFAYPEFGCKHAPGSIVPEKDRSSDFCPGNEGVYCFLENILDEVMAIFPSKYIHVGGDEAGMSAWKTCPMCKKKMQELGLAENDFNGLQAYLITRMGKYLESKGRRLVGWDEVIYDGLGDNTTIMVWRTRNYAANAIKKGYDVIMTPTEHCYLDYYQDYPKKEPAAIGGFLPFKSTCGLNPEFGLTEKDYGHIKGVQANLWTEYVHTPAHVEYMLYPRMLAIAEIGWSGKMDNEGERYKAFKKDVVDELSRMRSEGIYTFDLANEYGDRPSSIKPCKHLAVGCPVTYNMPFSEQYAAKREKNMTDGKKGGWKFNDGKWQGFLQGKDMDKPCLDVTLDLGRTRNIKSILMDFYQSAGAWIYYPLELNILISKDGENFKEIYSLTTPAENAPGQETKFMGWEGNKTKARFIRVKGTGVERGKWIFLDEIVVK